MNDTVHFEKTLSSETLFEGRVITLTKDTALLENGKTATREVVHHHGGACILPYFADGTICMVRQFRYAMQQQLWELPAGKLEKGEDPFAAAKRELEEECGLTADNYISLGEFYPTVGYDTEVIYTWVATGLHETKMHLDADEFLTPDRVPLEKAYQMVMSGEIKDGKTIAGILKLKALLAEGKLSFQLQDAALVVLDKPAGLSSEEGVPAALRAHWNAPDAFVGVVHRLDTGVSGLMVYARTPAAAAALSRQVTQSQDAYAVQDGRAEGKAAAPQFVKQYRAVLAGVPDAQLPAAGVLRDYLFKDSRKGRVFPVSRPRKGVREAVLEYRILATAGENSLAEITLHTGRTHQIRVQFASRRHPLYGDGKYGSRQKGSIALQSCGLRFVHPDTGKPMAFSLPLPAAAPWKEFLELGE